MKFYRKTQAWAAQHADAALDLIRIYLGVVLILKAIFFLSNRAELVSLIDETGTLWFAPAIMAHYIIAAHLVGGFMLVVGLFTRFAALIQIPILMGALFWIHMPRMISMGAREDAELSALLFFLVLVISLYGAGRWSLDNYLSKNAGDARRIEGTA